MPRVKGGYTTRRRRKGILKLAKGYFGSKRTLYKTAHEQVMRSLAYAYRDRKQKKREFRKLWIARINAACKMNGYKYSLLVSGLNKAGITINRKMLADVAIVDAAAFTEIVELAKKGNSGELKATKVEAPVKKAPAKKTVKVEEVVEAKPAKKAAKVEETVEAKPAKKAAKVEKVVEAKPAKKAETADVDYSAMTVAQLKETAKAKGITGISAMKKADLIAALTK